MKNNRQIGLNGKVFISNCLRRGNLFVFLLMIGGAFSAVADILKLTGMSGAVMSSFTTTLLIYDFIVSLLLVVVMFYAYFLECGTSVPVLKERPLVIFGLFRLGYYILLAYYICYRALYCVVYPQEVSPFLSVYYGVYFVFILLCILANCYVYNIITRNIIRRSYINSFQRMAICGMVVQGLLVVAYVVARCTIRDIGDEYFTASLCDMFRLGVCPCFTTALWFLFICGIENVKEVFGEVDNALAERRYQITYSSAASGGKSAALPGGKPASAAFLPTPTDKTAQQQKALPAMTRTPARPQQPAQHNAPPTVPHSQMQPSPLEPKEFEPKAQPAAQQSVPFVEQADGLQQQYMPVMPAQEFNPYPEDRAPRPVTMQPRPVARNGQKPVKKTQGKPAQSYAQQNTNKSRNGHR